MTTRKCTTAGNVRRTVEAEPAAKPRPVMQTAVDMRLTTADLAKLTPEQTRAVFESVGRLAALGLFR